MLRHNMPEDEVSSTFLNYV